MAHLNKNELAKMGQPLGGAKMEDIFRDEALTPLKVTWRPKEFLGVWYCMQASQKTVNSLAIQTFKLSNRPSNLQET